MQKKLMVILCVTLVLLLGGIVFSAAARKKEKMQPVKKSDAYTVETKIPYPMQKTGIEDLYYAVDQFGKQVQFVRLRDGEPEVVSPEGKYAVVLPSSHEQIPVDLYYVHENGSLTGVGLFANTNEKSDVHFYSFAFCRLLAMPPQLVDRGTALLAVDYCPEHLYTDKLYTDFFVFDEKSGDVSYLFAQEQRTLDKTARMRSDYTVLTDYLLANNTEPFLFLSGRMHNLDSETYDLYQSGYRDEYNTDNTPFVKDCVGNVFYTNENTVSYWQENASNAFALVNENGTVRSFDGDRDRDYVLKDRYLLRIADGLLYDAVNDAEIQLDWSELGIHTEVLDFDVSENGKTVAVLAVNSKSKPCIFIYRSDGERTLCDADSLYGMTVSLCAANDGTVCVSIARTPDAQQCTQLIFK